MKTFTAEELKEVLAQHKLWLDSDYEQGTRANLRDANLRGANLRDANLRDANLRDANLRVADLRDANLTRANLISADLTNANLAGANLRGANLISANLRDANLRGANLRGANLRDANLRDANLTRANLISADLTNANLAGANLRGANLPHFAHCPQEGDFIAFKKLAGGVIAKLRVPADAARTSSLVGRKCRAEYVVVLELSDGVEFAVSSHDNKKRYAVGETVHPDNYDANPAVECTNGIHFFISRAEAEAY